MCQNFNKIVTYGRYSAKNYYIRSKPILNVMTQENTRPSFLTVLCILTWVGSGFILISQLFSLAMAPMLKATSSLAQEGMEEAMDELSSDAPGFAPIFQKFMGQGMQAIEHHVELSLIRIIGVLLVLFGAITMWKLKKMGFYLFLGGKMVIIIGVFIIMGASGLAFLSIIGSLFVAIAFGIMYGVNLKYMK